MNYHQITIHTVSEAVEALSYALLELGSGGVEIFDPKDILMQDKSPLSWDYIDEDLLKDLSRDEVLMRVYFSEEAVPDPAALENLLLKIRQAISGVSEYLPVGSGIVETSLSREDDWMNAWKAYYRPFRLGKHIFVVPSWIEAETKPGDIRIEMDPGMAFGTGTHETTSMCIEALEEMVHPGDTVLDIGCGSGILGIVAAKCGAGKVIGSDLDVNAVRVAKENVQKNHVSDVVSIVHADLASSEAFKDIQADVIAANIIADVIIDLAPKAVHLLKKGGYFVTSGIILERRDDVLGAIQKAGYEVLAVSEKGSWCCILSRLIS